MTRPRRGVLSLHLTLLVGLAGCAVASYIEWRRALSGHVIAWAYAFEWPLFAVLGTWVWWRLLHADSVPHKISAQRGDSAPRGLRRATRARATVAPDDPQLVAWQEYLARLHAVDPPGGPPG